MLVSNCEVVLCLQSSQDFMRHFQGIFEKGAILFEDEVQKGMREVDVPLAHKMLGDIVSHVISFSF